MYTKVGMAKIRPDRRGVRLDALPAGSPGILKSAQQAEAHSDRTTQRASLPTPAATLISGQVESNPSFFFLNLYDSR